MYRKETLEINSQGELISGECINIRSIKADEYCQLYIKDESEYYRLTKAEANLLSVCIAYSEYYPDDKKYDYPGNMIQVHTWFKERALELTGLSEGTIRNTLTTLVKKGMLLKDSKHRGIYFLNPQYFFKGTISSRTQLIKKVDIWQTEQPIPEELEGFENIE